MSVNDSTPCSCALVRHLAAERRASINAADAEGTTALQAPLCVTSMHPASAGAHAHLTVNRSASEGSAGGDLGVVEQQQSRFCLYRCPRDSMNVVWNSERLGKQWCAGQVEGKAAPSPAVEHFACRCDTSWQAAMAPDAMAGASTVWRVEGRERPGLFMSLPAVGCQSSH